MIAGLPGTGIGRIFYMPIALWMPVDHTIKNMRSHANSDRNRLVKEHLLLTLCVIIVVIATGGSQDGWQ